MLSRREASRDDPLLGEQYAPSVGGEEEKKNAARVAAFCFEGPLRSARVGAASGIFLRTPKRSPLAKSLSRTATKQWRVFSPNLNAGSVSVPLAPQTRRAICHTDVPCGSPQF
ncbi:hypothetical protein HPB50_024138 [Hyalomma asiaticum]|uniref:Uncharacterized protein n=1 Tax=Hyalomma asiaticum TaxID=266040 RepID=A0ACB7TMY8_HYAAI|nr:hypothetical protein HPB50_024138 [Hyalomma asiaticum]